MSPENNISPPPGLRLPVGKILLGALALSWMQRQNLFRGLAATTLLIIGLKVFWQFAHTGFGNFAALGFMVLSMLLHAKFAVICHRLILVDFNRRSEFIHPFSWRDRETRFFGWMLAVYFLVSIASIVLMMVPFSLFTQSLPEATRNDPTRILPYAVLFIGPLATYLLGRLSLVFPASALDRTEKLGWAWRQSKGNGIQLMVIVGLLPWISGLLNYFLIGPQPGVPTIIVANIVNYLFMAVEIVALSLVYRELAKDGG